MLVWMAAKKKMSKSKHEQQEEARAAVEKAERRVLLLVQRWAKHTHARGVSVLSSPSHHLLRAVDKLNSLSLV
jgi:hypothetical protein